MIPRVIPCLLLKDGRLVKTIKFKKYNYIGDPLNTAKIFNELEVDELMLLDIFASLQNKNINFNFLKKIAKECHMPLSYGGNIKSFDDAKKIFNLGFEKIVINSSAFINLELITEISKFFGSQSIIGSIDIKKNFFGQKKIYSHHGTKKQSYSVVNWASKLVKAGVGELLITSIDNEGTWDGYDADLIQSITKKTEVPVIANGGCGNINHIADVVKKANASACAVGSMFVYQKKGMGVLVNILNTKELAKFF